MDSVQMNQRPHRWLLSLLSPRKSVVKASLAAALLLRNPKNISLVQQAVHRFLLLLPVLRRSGARLWYSKGSILCLPMLTPPGCHPSLHQERHSCASITWPPRTAGADVLRWQGQPVFPDATENLTPGTFHGFGECLKVSP